MKKDSFIPLLKKAGYKITRPRLLVLSFLAKAKHPVSAKEIIQGLRIDQVTVYRTLEALKREEIIRQVSFQENAAYFELQDAEKDHHHIVCIECKKVEDFTGCESEKLAKKIINKKSDFARITNHSFEFFGVCKSCV